jgi:hypothetical protein
VKIDMQEDSVKWGACTMWHNRNTECVENGSPDPGRGKVLGEAQWGALPRWIVNPLNFVMRWLLLHALALC